MFDQTGHRNGHCTHFGGGALETFINVQVHSSPFTSIFEKYLGNKKQDVVTFTTLQSFGLLTICDQTDRSGAPMLGRNGHCKHFGGGA